MSRGFSRIIKGKEYIILDNCANQGKDTEFDSSEEAKLFAKKLREYKIHPRVIKLKATAWYLACWVIYVPMNEKAMDLLIKWYHD